MTVIYYTDRPQQASWGKHERDGVRDWKSSRHPKPLEELPAEGLRQGARSEDSALCTGRLLCGCVCMHVHLHVCTHAHMWTFGPSHSRQEQNE